MIGRKTLNDHSKPMMSWDVGKILHNCKPNEQNEWQDSSSKCSEVEAVDGLLIATQYDIRWRSDIFTGWDFYDFSQCCEFRRAGLKVVIPYQAEAWCYHDNHSADMKNYERYRDIFREEYWNESICKNRYCNEEMKCGEIKYRDINEKVVLLLDQMLQDQNLELISFVFKNKENRGYLSLKEYELLGRIYNEEQKALTENSFFKPEENKEKLFHKLRSIKFLVKRIEHGIGEKDDNLKLLINNFPLTSIGIIIDSYCNPKDIERMKRIIGLLCS